MKSQAKIVKGDSEITGVRSNRKVAQSVYSTENPLNVERRRRVDSTYTTMSGDDVIVENTSS